MIKRSLLWVLAAYCIGIVFRDRLKWMLWAVLFSCAFWGYAVLRTKGTGREAGIKGAFLGMRVYEVQHFSQKGKCFWAVLLFAVLFGAFMGKLQAAEYPIDAVLTEKRAAQAEGRIRSISEAKSGYRLELNHIDIDFADSVGTKEETNRYTRGKLLVYCESAEGLKIGNRIRVEGKAVPFAAPENAGQFDERAYYRAERMCCKFNADAVEILDTGVDEIREWCRLLRSRLDAIYEEILPLKHAGIVSAVLLGDKTELEADTKNLYQKNGIAHILAISGLHVSLLGMGLFALIRKVGSPLIPAAAVTMLILVFYGGMTEFIVSTLRAVGMLVIAMFAKILGRSYDSRSACALCGLMILLVNPMQLYQAGFQLSFAAAFGIAYFGRELEQMKLNKGKTVSKKLMMSFLSGVTTQLITAPIILNCFYEIPVYAVFLNLPVIGLLSSMVLLSILAGFSGMFSYSLGKFFAGAVYGILELYEALCRIAEWLPCPIWLCGKPQKWSLVAYCIVLVLFFVVAAKIGKRYRHHPRQARYRRWAFLVLCLLPLVFVRGERGVAGGKAGCEQEEADCVVDFLSVGQGDGTVVRTQSGNTYLIDCGSSSVTSVGEYRLKPWLKFHGIAKLEAVFLSHPDSDHTNGVMELLEKTNAPDDWYRGEIQIANLVLPAAYREDKGFSEILKLAKEKNIPVLWFDTGDRVTEEGIDFTCLHPVDDYPVYGNNDASMVLMLESADTVVLFTGDIGRNVEEQMLSESDDMACTQQIMRQGSDMSGMQSEGQNRKVNKKTVILKVAHHGSKNSTSEEFLDVLQPDVAVISCGRDNRFGHPHEETVKRLQEVGSKIVSTPECGTVTVLVSEEETVVRGYKDDGTYYITQ